MKLIEGKDYRFLDHTADLGVDVYAGDRKGLYINSALLLRDLIASDYVSGGEVEMKIALEASNAEELLVDWLSEFLYLINVKKLILNRIIKLKLSPDGIMSKVVFNEIEKGSLTIKNEIKAVTFHDLEISETESGFMARIIFDI